MRVNAYKEFHNDFSNGYNYEEPIQKKRNKDVPQLRVVFEGVNRSFFIARPFNSFSHYSQLYIPRSPFTELFLSLLTEIRNGKAADGEVVVKSKSFRVTSPATMFGNDQLQKYPSYKGTLKLTYTIEKQYLSKFTRDTLLGFVLAISSVYQQGIENNTLDCSKFDFQPVKLSELDLPAMHYFGKPTQERFKDREGDLKKAFTHAGYYNTKPFVEAVKLLSHLKVNAVFESDSAQALDFSFRPEGIPFLEFSDDGDFSFQLATPISFCFLYFSSGYQAFERGFLCGDRRDFGLALMAFELYYRHLFYSPYYSKKDLRGNDWLLPKILPTYLEYLSKSNLNRRAGKKELRQKIINNFTTLLNCHAFLFCFKLKVDPKYTPSQFQGAYSLEGCNPDQIVDMRFNYVLMQLPICDTKGHKKLSTCKSAFHIV